MQLIHPTARLCGKALSAMPILRSGCCWRVGNGEAIRVSKDKWILDYPSNKILHPVAEEGEEWMVLDLIDLDLQWWRRDIIMASFHRDDAKAICRIPLSQRHIADSIFWLHNKNGAYSVRPGYHLARKVLRNENWAECSRGTEG